MMVSWSYLYTVCRRTANPVDLLDALSTLQIDRSVNSGLCLMPVFELLLPPCCYLISKVIAAILDLFLLLADTVL